MNWFIAKWRQWDNFNLSDADKKAGAFPCCKCDRNPKLQKKHELFNEDELKNMKRLV